MRNSRKKRPGVEYDASMIANLKVSDPWKVDPNYEVPAVCLKLINLKEAGAIIETWNAKLAASGRQLPHGIG